MYRVYANNKVLHHPHLFERGYILLDTVRIESSNVHGSFEFTMLPTHPEYDNLKKLVTWIYIYDDDKEVFRGRVLTDTIDFQNNKRVYCEGELAVFVDSVVRPFTYAGTVRGFVQKLIDNHNGQVAEDKRFTLGQVTVTDSNDYIVRESNAAMTTWDAITSRMVELMGGYVRVRKVGNTRYFDYIERYDRVASQEIVFGENLLDMERFVSAENLYTCLIPYGAQLNQGDSGYVVPPASGEYDGNRVTIKTVNGGKDYIKNDTAVGLFGQIWKAATWDDVTLPANLLTKARAYLDANVVESLSITAKAVDLFLFDPAVKSIELGDLVRTRSALHDVDVYLQVTEKQYSLLKPEDCVITLGFPRTDLTTYISDKTR